MRTTTTRFKMLDDYTFDDPSRRYNSSREEIYEGTRCQRQCKCEG